MTLRCCSLKYRSALTIWAMISRASFSDNGPRCRKYCGTRAGRPPITNPDRRCEVLSNRRRLPPSRTTAAVAVLPARAAHLFQVLARAVFKHGGGRAAVDLKHVQQAHNSRVPQACGCRSARTQDRKTSVPRHQTADRGPAPTHRPTASPGVGVCALCWISCSRKKCLT